MTLIHLSSLDLGLASVLVIALAVVSYRMGLGIGRRMLVAALRTVIQLTLVGLVLKALFAHVHIGWVTLMALFMLTVAGAEVVARQQRRLSGWRGYGVGALSMFVSSFSIAILGLTVVVGPTPWYTPQYAIPLLGMLLGNTMTGVALSMDHLTRSAWQQRQAIEARLMLGHPWHQAIGEIRRESARSGLVPTVNAMAAAGLVSLPGMMTGQILSGTPPVEAVKYQILIMLLITAGTGFGTIAAVHMTSRHLFDQRQRLRLDHLENKT